MIVNDEQDVISFVTNVLRQNGYANVNGFSDPRKALDDFKQSYKGYVLVISDISMPHMNGFVFARRIRTIHPSINLVLMTSFEMTRRELNMVFPSLEVNEVLKKPFSGNQILALVRKYDGAMLH